MMVLGVLLWLSLQAGEGHPLSEAERAALRKSFDEEIARSTTVLGVESKDEDALSRRGDARFFRGDFKGALADYDRMIELDPSQSAQHWRRGIVCFYLGEYAKAQAQFEAYHTHDDVDRENGIWRFLSQTKAVGLDRAREGLLKYKKDDREPFPAVYQLFAGGTTPDKILEGIRTSAIDEEARAGRLFYAHLYIGLDHAVGGRPEAAKASLREAVANRWARGAGFGPAWMWQVGRLHYEILAGAK
jgi:lipoprotein NlpI